MASEGSSTKLRVGDPGRTNWSCIRSAALPASEANHCAGALATSARGTHLLVVYEPERAYPLWTTQLRIDQDTDIDARRVEHNPIAQTAGGALMGVAVVGTILLPVGLARDDDTLLYTSGGLLGVGTLGFLLLWRPPEADVTVTPAAARMRGFAPTTDSGRTPTQPWMRS